MVIVLKGLTYLLRIDDDAVFVRLCMIRFVENFREFCHCWCVILCRRGFICVLNEI